MIAGAIIIKSESCLLRTEEKAMKFVPLTPEQRRSFEEDGFLVVKQALDQEMVGRLLAAGDRIAHSFLHKPPVLTGRNTITSISGRGCWKSRRWSISSPARRLSR